jgi:hypothetical protein
MLVADLEVSSADVVAHNCARNDKGPEGSHRISPDGLKHCHVVFDILGLNGIGPEVAHRLFIKGCVLNLLGIARLFSLFVAHGDFGGVNGEDEDQMESGEGCNACL